MSTASNGTGAASAATTSAVTGIVDIDIPAPQFGGNPPGQTTVGGDQRRGSRLVFQCFAQHQGNGQRLGLRSGTVDPPHAGKRHTDIGRQRNGGGRGGRTQGAVHRIDPGIFICRCIAPVGDVFNIQTDPPEEARHAVLRMGRDERGQTVCIQRFIQTGQNKQAGIQFGNAGEQVGRRGDAARGPGGDYGSGRRCFLPERDLCLDQPVAPVRGIKAAMLGEDRRPVLGDDL
ncbi:MAG: hypothetical protein ACKVH1_01655 [Alphaproteobacteria bacterium]